MLKKMPNFAKAFMRRKIGLVAQLDRATAF